jgi:V/A-type H+-transporting ATPase subunit F
MSKQKSESNNSIAVIGDRQLVLGYRLLGVDDTFIVNGPDESLKNMETLFFSRKFNMIIASQFVRDSLPHVFRARVEASIEPLVIFMPSLQGDIHEESISSLARRVLGISIKIG